MPSYAQVDPDLTTRYGGAIPAGVDAQTLLDDASFWLSAWVDGLDDAITGGDAELIEAAKLLVVAMVKRSLLDGGSESRQQENFGVFSVRYRTPEGNLFLYGREFDSLLDLLRSNRATAVSMRSPGL
jgi:hypothetical protein